jgi:hypothetical protein
MFRRGGSPAARSKGRRGLRNSRRFGCTPCRGLWWSEKRISIRTRGGGGEVTVDGEAPAVDGEAPAVNVGKGPAHEL